MKKPSYGLIVLYLGLLLLPQISLSQNAVTTVVTNNDAAAEEKARNYFTDLEVVDQNGNDCHVLRFLSVGEDHYGAYTGSGFNGGIPGHVAEIYIGAFYNSLRTPERMQLWRPMSQGDTPQQRVIDLGEAIGRTAAHELGHIFHLVSRGWMPKHHWHNPVVVNGAPTITRFGNGKFIMDGSSYCLCQ